MIKEYEYLHGVVFSRLCNTIETSVSIKKYALHGISSYIINNRAGLYIKYSGKRLSPWTFTFTQTHKTEVEELSRIYKDVFIALVCYLDGVAVLTFSELQLLLGNTQTISDGISVKRKRNSMYEVLSSSGKLGFKVSMTSCPDKILTAIGG